MKIDKTVIKETGYITVGQVCLCAVMLAVYFFLDKLTLNVFIGAVVGSALAVANFFLIGYSVQRALNTDEDEQAKLMRTSQTIRLMVIALIVVVCLAVPKLDPIATLLPLLFPRIVIFFRSLVIKKDDR